LFKNASSKWTTEISDALHIKASLITVAKSGFVKVKLPNVVVRVPQILLHPLDELLVELGTHLTVLRTVTELGIIGTIISRDVNQ
jgi:hypothetical protein